MRRKLLALGLGSAALGGIGLLFGWILDARRASYAYLFAYAALFSIVIGALFLVMIGHASGARWFVATRRLAEHVVGVSPLLALLLVPILMSMKALYPWTRVADLPPEAREYVMRKSAWLNEPSFVLRSAVYLILFVGTGELLRRWSLQQDADDDAAKGLRQRMVALSGGALVVIALALTFASFDWLMSLEPTWYSNIYGVYVFAGGFVAALGLFGVLLVPARAQGLLPSGVSAEHYHAIGRLELAMIIFWAYIAWAQLLLYWIADMPLEVTWYVARWRNGWQWIGLALIGLHWAVPFFWLLQARLKRQGSTFFAMSAWIVAVHLLDVYYLVLPAYGPLRVSILDLASVAAVSGAALAFGAWRAGGVESHPVHDPLLEESLRYEAA